MVHFSFKSNLQFKSGMEFNIAVAHHWRLQSSPARTIFSQTALSVSQMPFIMYMPANLEYLNLATKVKNHRQFI